LRRVIALGLALGVFTLCLRAEAAAQLDKIHLPPGFSIEVFGLTPGARSISVSAELNIVFVGSKSGAVYAIPFKNAMAAKTLILKDGLILPHGVAWRDGYLYVGEQHRITRYRGASLKALLKAPPEVIFDDMNPSSWHGRRDLAFDPEGNLYVALGTPCNICKPGRHEGVIMRMGADGSNPVVFANGIRNSVGMDFHPTTGELHFTDNGADKMGNDIPPEELNRAAKSGLHFGYPFFGGGKARTRQFQKARPPANAVQPDLKFGAHVAPLGLHFYRGDMFPKDMRFDAFVAHHGSWNRDIPDGYRVARVRFDEKGRAQSWQPFAEGWLQGPRAWGRPADVNELPDGSLLVSDDKQGVIYRISYTP